MKKLIRLLVIPRKLNEIDNSVNETLILTYEQENFTVFQVIPLFYVSSTYDAIKNR